MDQQKQNGEHLILLLVNTCPWKEHWLPFLSHSFHEIQSMLSASSDLISILPRAVLLQQNVSFPLDITHTKMEFNNAIFAFLLKWVDCFYNSVLTEHS